MSPVLWWVSGAIACSIGCVNFRDEEIRPLCAAVRARPTGEPLLRTPVPAGQAVVQGARDERWSVPHLQLTLPRAAGAVTSLLDCAAACCLLMRSAARCYITHRCPSVDVCASVHGACAGLPPRCAVCTLPAHRFRMSQPCLHNFDPSSCQLWKYP